MRIKAATQLEIAEAFAVTPATVRRWETRLADAGVAGLLAEPKGPKRKSKLTADTVAAIRRLREDGVSYRGIAADIGVSQDSVRNALVLADDGTHTREACPAATSDTPREPESEPESGAGAEQQVDAGRDCPAAVSDDMSEVLVTEPGKGALPTWPDGADWH
jgi:transposase